MSKAPILWTHERQREENAEHERQRAEEARLDAICTDGGEHEKVFSGFHTDGVPSGWLWVCAKCLRVAREMTNDTPAGIDASRYDALLTRRRSGAQP